MSTFEAPATRSNRTTAFLSGKAPSSISIALGTRPRVREVTKTQEGVPVSIKKQLRQVLLLPDVIEDKENVSQLGFLFEAVHVDLFETTRELPVKECLDFADIRCMPDCDEADLLEKLPRIPESRDGCRHGCLARATRPSQNDHRATHWREK